MSERVYSRQFHAETGAEAWRVLPEGAQAHPQMGEDARIIFLALGEGGQLLERGIAQRSLGPHRRGPEVDGEGEKDRQQGEL